MTLEQLATRHHSFGPTVSLPISHKEQRWPPHPTLVWTLSAIAVQALIPFTSLSLGLAPVTCSFPSPPSSRGGTRCSDLPWLWRSHLDTTTLYSPTKMSSWRIMMTHLIFGRQTWARIHGSEWRYSQSWYLSQPEVLLEAIFVTNPFQIGYQIEHCQSGKKFASGQYCAPRFSTYFRGPFFSLISKGKLLKSKNGSSKKVRESELETDHVDHKIIWRW